MKEKKKKLTQSEIDGVQYRRAKLWQIICYACNAFIGMSVYSLIGMASYSASIGFGVATAVVGVILTCTRILDGITDPLLAFRSEEHTSTLFPYTTLFRSCICVRPRKHKVW